MNYNISFSDFVYYVEEHLLEGWNENREIKIETIQKNNGLNYTALILYKEGEEAAPTMYLEDAYDHYCSGMNLQNTMRWIRESYDYAEETLEGLFVDILNFEAMADKIIYRMVHYERNKEMLQDCPHIRMHDLAVTFRCVMQWDDIAVSSTLIHNELYRQWDVDLDTLLLLATANTRRLFPAVMYPMSDCFSETGAGFFFPGTEQLYVVTNKQMINGASVMLYEGILEDFALDIGSNYYILPSSIHEIILVPECMVSDGWDLIDLVREVNETVVDQVDFLSDSVYYYNGDLKELSCLTPHF